MDIDKEIAKLGKLTVAIAEIRARIESGETIALDELKRMAETVDSFYGIHAKFLMAVSQNSDSKATLAQTMVDMYNERPKIDRLLWAIQVRIPDDLPTITVALKPPSRGIAPSDKYVEDF